MQKTVVLFFIILISMMCFAEEVTIPPTDDMYTDCLASGTHPENELYINKEDSPSEERIMFKFDVSSVLTLESAVFNLHRYFACGGGGGQTITNIYPITEEWDEETWDVHTFPQYDENTVIPFTFTGPTAAQDTWYEIDITTFAELWVYDIMPNNGFVIIADYGQRHSKFNSKESASIDFHPSLTLNATLPAVENEIITSFNAYNYPNPFNPETVISFNISEEKGSLTIFNPLGQIILQQNFAKGEQNYTWKADHYSSGTYFYQVKSGERVVNRKMVLLK